VRFNDFNEVSSIFPRYIAPDFLQYLCERTNKLTKQNRGTTMKTKLTETKFKSSIGRAGQLFSWVACLGAVILICSSTSAQNLFVSGSDAHGGAIFRFTWDGGQSVFASGLYRPWDMAFDSAGNLYVVDYMIVGGDLRGNAAIFKITPNGTLTTFASGLSYASSLAVDKAGNLFVADYDNGIIYQYKPSGSRATFASGLNHPVGMALDSAGNLFVVDNNAGNIYQGHIYQYKPNGSRTIFAALEPSDRPTDLAFDSMGNLLMADLGGNIYRYDLVVLRRHPRTTFGSVPDSAQSVACDNAGNLFVVDVGGTGTAIPNAIYKFTQQGVRSTFASGQALSESFACLAFQPIPCCE
jgi:sugar lactone lactonase YvrE